VYRRLSLGLFALFAFWVWTTAQVLATPVQWDVNGHWYEVIRTWETPDLPNSGVTWDVAADYATLLGGYLVTITSAEENDFVYSLLEDTDEWIWLGGYQSSTATAPDEGWQWVTGEPWTFTNWAVYNERDPYGNLYHEPNDQDNDADWTYFENHAEDYLMMFNIVARDGSEQRGTWNDTDNSPKAVFIVEYNTNPSGGGVPVPEPTTMLLVGLGMGGVFLIRSRRGGLVRPGNNK